MPASTRDNLPDPISALAHSVLEFTGYHVAEAESAMDFHENAYTGMAG
jgi:hypothetical protein